MNLFVWQRVDRMTENYHHEAGVVVIAETLERAREIAEEHRATSRREEPSQISTKLPDVERVGVAGPEACWVFPDAGCC